MVNHPSSEVGRTHQRMQSVVEVKAADPQPFMYGGSPRHKFAFHRKRNNQILTYNGSLEKSFHVNVLLVRHVTGMKHSRSLNPTSDTWNTIPLPIFQLWPRSTCLCGTVRRSTVWKPISGTLSEQQPIERNGRAIDCAHVCLSLKHFAQIEFFSHPEC